MNTVAVNSQETPSKTSPQFILSIKAGLRYWQKKTETLEPKQVQWLDQRRKNLHQAILFGLNQPETWEDTAQLLLQAFDFSEWRGYWSEWIPVLEQALAVAPEKETVVYGRLQNRLGQLYRLDIRYLDSIKQHEQALQLAQKLASRELRLLSYTALIEVYLKQNKLEQAEKYGQMALELAQMDQSDERREAHILINLAEAARFKGNWHQAIEYLQKAANSFRTQNNPVYLARCLNDLGISYLQGEDFAKAQCAFEEAGQILQGTINEIDKAKIYLNLGVLFYRQEKWGEAAEAFLQINPVALREQHELNLLASLYNNLGNVYLKMERWEKASEYLNLAIELFRQKGNELDLGNSLGTLASVYKQDGKQREALQLYEEAIKMLLRFPESEWAQKLLGEFGTAYEGLRAKKTE